MKIALITDTHLGVRNDNLSFHEYFKKSTDWFFDEIDKRGIHHCIHLGDLFDRRKYLNFVTAKRCREDFLVPLQNRGIETHILAGNHDVYYRNTNEINSLDEIVGDRYPNIRTYKDPALINIGDLDIQLLPWISESNFSQSMEAIAKSPASILMGHLELNGFEMFRGSVSDHGMDSNLFNRYDMVLSGHYHHKSTYLNIHYLGAFAEYTWSDYDDPRGFHILDTETRELVFLRNPNIMFRMMTYDDVKHKDIIDKINATDYSKYGGCYTKIVCVNKTNPYAFDLLFEKLYKEAPLDISIVEDISGFTDNEEDSSIDEAEDTPTILNKYISGLTLPVDNDRMKRYMLEIYREAQTLETI